MQKEIRVLIIDDDENDAILITRALKKGGLNVACKHVKNAAQLRLALLNDWDMLISDHNMPTFSSSDVINMVRSFNPNLPVIVASGTMADSVGVEAMKAGAQDYVMKDNLSRLVPAVERELQSSRTRHEKQHVENSLAHLATHDALTNLINRQTFESRLRERANRPEPDQGILMYLDIDQFMYVNDSCGHVAGDELLKQVTRKLQLHIRETDTLARVGGDEFAILIERGDKEMALHLAERIRQEIRTLNFTWQGKPYAISMSIGLVALNENIDADRLLSAADMACYVAKKSGSNGIHWYTEDSEASVQRREDMQWANRIRHALKENLFELHFQPMKQVTGTTGGPHGEFLTRLKDNGQLIPPGLFIPAAEKYHLMPLLDRWVVEHVFRLLAQSGRGQANSGTYFINLSGNSLSDPAFFDDVRLLLREYRIEPNRICLEITETAAIDNLNDAVEFIGEIRDQGCRFALDDFGVGMSSFSYLKTIPVDYLKIDGSFVRNLLEDPIDMGIVEACNQISHRAGLKTIAEFVENAAIEAALKTIGVDFAQGFGIAKPSPWRDE